MTQDEKTAILANISNISAINLAKCILDNDLTLDEIMDTGELGSDKRLEVIAIIKADEESRERKERLDWTVVSSSKNISGIEKYINDYPNGSYSQEAVQLLEEIKNGHQEKNALLEKIRINEPPGYTPDVIYGFIQSGKITKEDLIDLGIPKVIIDNLDKESQDLEVGTSPEEIENGYTEVYFWGLPGSGKTCALSAILSMGVIDGDIDPQQGEGLHYMNQLSNVFLKRTFGVLPGPTKIEETQYLPFDLTDNNKVKHPIALIELSGEIFKAFNKKSSNIPLSNVLESTYDKTKSYLNGPNKKIHFFIIDISKDPTKPDRDGITQQQYLHAMAKFLDNEKVFRNTTDGVFIVTTKSDVLSEDPSLRKDLAIKHLNNNYKSFSNSLKSILKNNKLPESLNVIPFTLGEVYFNTLCCFDNSSSNEIIELLKKKTSKENGGGIIKWIKEIFNN